MTEPSGAPQQGTEAYEAEHVHRVYEQIAPHFSATRFKPWPIVERFLKGLPDGAVGLDVGCGNGKYLTVNPNVYILGSDRSSNLVKIAAEKQHHEAVIADAIDSPHPWGRFDFAISIAVIHHFSSAERRIASIRNILSLLKPQFDNQPETGGTALIYVWALEQRPSRRGWDENSDQDVFVPWVMQQKLAGSVDKERYEKYPAPSTITFQRYYHLYRQGELEQDILSAGGMVSSSGYEKDNWWAIAKFKPQG